MDNSSRENEDHMFDMIRDGEGGAPEGGQEEPITDGSEFLNLTGDGMEPEQTDEAQTSIDCDDDDNVGLVVTKSGEVY